MIRPALHVSDFSPAIVYGSVSNITDYTPHLPTLSSPRFELDRVWTYPSAL